MSTEIFLDWLPNNITWEKLRKCLQTFGEVTNMKIKYPTLEDSTKSKTASAVVSFSTRSSAEKCKDGKKLLWELLNAIIYVNWRENIQSETEIFLNWLPNNITEEKLREGLQTFGEVTDVNIKYSTKSKNACAFVSFSTRSSAENCKNGKEMLWEFFDAIIYVNWRDNIQSETKIFEEVSNKKIEDPLKELPKLNYLSNSTMKFDTSDSLERFKNRVFRANSSINWDNRNSSGCLYPYSPPKVNLNNLSPRSTNPFPCPPPSPYANSNKGCIFSKEKYHEIRNDFGQLVCPKSLKQNSVASMKSENNDWFYMSVEGCFEYKNHENCNSKGNFNPESAEVNEYINGEVTNSPQEIEKVEDYERKKKILSNIEEFEKLRLEKQDLLKQLSQLNSSIEDIETETTDIRIWISKTLSIIKEQFMVQFMNTKIQNKIDELEKLRLKKQDLLEQFSQLNSSIKVFETDLMIDISIWMSDLKKLKLASV